ncbi:hypothetical protein CHISP_1520 [Chitinispirillum alkaliphilum]|nr:hypothetical protein CHISP_1520 [Chitinispirillum alkaliphilum]
MFFFLIMIFCAIFETSAGDIIITEIFPRGRIDQPEWFEIKNISTNQINLKDWSFSTGMDTASFSDSILIIDPGKFLVFTRSQTLLKRKYPLLKTIEQPPRWLSLNNHNDTVSILNNRGELSDYVMYSSSWFTGWSIQSVERICIECSGTESDSWTLAHPPSPGLPNRSVNSFTQNSSISIGPIPFKPNGDGVDDFLAIIPSYGQKVSLNIILYSFDGKELVSLPASDGTILWDGRCRRGNLVNSGPFFVVAEFTCKDGRKTYVRKMGVLWR